MTEHLWFSSPPSFSGSFILILQIQLTPWSQSTVFPEVSYSKDLSVVHPLLLQLPSLFKRSNLVSSFYTPLTAMSTKPSAHFSVMFLVHSPLRGSYHSWPHRPLRKIYFPLLSCITFSRVSSTLLSPFLCPLCWLLASFSSATYILSISVSALSLSPCLSLCNHLHFLAI